MDKINWKWYAVGEAFAKTVNNSLAKILGLSGGSFGTSVFTTFIMGCVQALGGGIIALSAKQKLFPGWKLVLGSFLFGTSACIMTVAGLLVFTFPEADIGVFVFISLFGLLLGVFIDWIFFKTPLSLSQWIGVLVFLCGGYGMLNFPSLREILELPSWILISFIVPLGLAINEGLTRAISISRISNPFVNNFWIGLTTAVVSIITLLLIDAEGVIVNVPLQLFTLSVLMGCIVIVMISCKLLAYKGGGTIAHKKIIMQGAHLLAATLVGALFFGESLTLGKGIGVVGFFVSMFLMESRRFGRGSKNVRA